MRTLFCLTILLSISLHSFSKKKVKGYTMLDFYRDNWIKDRKTGFYYEKHNLDSFIKANPTYIVDCNCPRTYSCFNGTPMKEITKIFGKPRSVILLTPKKATYAYQTGDWKDPPDKTVILQIDFNRQTDTVTLYARQVYHKGWIGLPGLRAGPVEKGILEDPLPFKEIDSGYDTIPRHIELLKKKTKSMVIIKQR